MPSPFPGMDPYIERPSLWPNMHQHLITAFAIELNRRLPSHYVANIGERVYVEEPYRPMYPDVSVSQWKAGPSNSFGSGGAAAAVCDDFVQVQEMPDDIHEPFIEIAHTSDMRVVTEIEILSPSNKDADNKGYAEYRRKQASVLNSQCHLLEIDLLRTGAHTVACSIMALKLRLKRRYDYLVCLHRARSGGEYWVCARTLRQPLPVIPVPLAGDDPDVSVELQAIFAQCYEDGRFDRNIDYTQPPDPPLSPEDAAWAAALVAEMKPAAR